ncbi:MAG TPA: ABC transporter permease [Candidatus Acidoferrum sp.]|nr:ABC transporter permease [Candidatus Acidoferrum sp.]
MKSVRRFFSRLRNFLSSVLPFLTTSHSPLATSSDARLREEIDAHIALQTAENVRAGLSPAEAHRQAKLKFGPVESMKEDYRAERSLPFVDTLLQDTRYALRIFRLNPAFFLFAVAVLGLGIGANAAIFTVAYNILLRPLPFRDASGLVMVWEDASAYGFPQDTPAPGNYASWRSQNNVFTGVAAMKDHRFDLTSEGEPQQFEGTEITANMFPLLGVEPARGRNILASEDKPGGNNVVILSHAVWMANFGGNRQIVGKQIWLDNSKYTIIGVMPRNFTFPDRETQLWTPIRFTDDDLANHGSHYLHVIARLKPGVSLKAANANLSFIAQGLAKQFPDSNTKVGAYAVPLRDRLTGSSRLAAIVLLGAVGFVLLIACANVANLLLARAAGRQKELAMRVALGAGRARIIRQLLTESIFLSIIAGAAGLLLAFAATPLLANLVPTGLAPIQGSGIGGSGISAEVLAFLVCVSVLCGVLFGIAPALRVAHLDLATSIKQSGKQSGSARRPMRDALVIAEVALALVLFSGATLMLRSFVNVRDLDPGFRPAHVLAAETELPFPKYQDVAQRNAFFDQVLDRINHLPGVVAAGCTTWLPLTNWGGATGIIIEGRPAPRPGQAIIPNTRMISSDYIQAIGMKLIEGRTFDSRDAPNTQPVALINQTAARKFWPGLDPVGMRFKRDDTPPQPWITIVGIVGDVRQAGLDQPPRPEIYLPFQQHDFFAPSYIAVRTSGDPMAFANAVREQVWAVDKDQPVTNVMPLETMLQDYLAPRKLQSGLLGGFAAFALLLASIGIYAVLAFSVSQRTQEIGVRVALGAQRQDIFRSILAQGLKLAGVGVAIGLIGSLALSRSLASWLFGVSATDPLTMAGAVIVLLAVAAAACYVPARRAMRVDPISALRHE